MLFDVIPESFFMVFAGSRRRINVHLIQRLYDVYFGEDADLDLPLASEVRVFLMSELQALPATLEDDRDTDDGDGSIEAQAHQFFSRLIDTQWLKITRDMGKKYVQMTAVAHRVLDFLIGLKAGLTEDFTIDLAGILSSLNTSVTKHEGRTCLAAQKQTRELIKKLKSLNASLLEIEDQIFVNKDLRLNLELLMQEFLENILIKEIAPLVTNNHPIRYKVEIMELVRLLRTETEHVDLLARNLSGSSKLDIDEAHDQLSDALSYIARAFDYVPSLMDRIDGNRKKLETRITNMTRYMDWSRETDLDRYRVLLRHFADYPAKDNEFILQQYQPGETLFAWPFVNPQWQLLCAASIHQPVDRRRKVAPRPQRRQQRNPAMDRRIRAVRHWEMFLEGNPKIARRIIEDTIKAGKPFYSADMTVDDLSDFVLFDKLRSLETVFEGVLKEDFSIERVGFGENNFAYFNHFVITPKSKSDNVHE